MKTDKIFAEPQAQISDFKFDDEVASVFPDMLRRSIPGYENVIVMSGLFAERFARPDSNIYDLGCSLGATTLAMRSRINAPGARIIAVDNSEAMIRRCREIIAADPNRIPVELVLDDIRNIDYRNNAMTVLNFTLQFLPPEARAPLLRRIYDSMLPGAILLLSEKITFADRFNGELFIDIYHAWKAHNGYSEMEIRQKRNALEKVLIPDTVSQHLARLEEIGFKRAELWFQCFNFISLAAFK
ncbi:MAG: carboxy-S-adenosyl-L-methionine synthase CmoA [Victivallales bacterium]|nr:carboxy-S-adenosyl-L-methionine synthase CmoA [Victivallales bacterium]